MTNQSRYGNTQPDHIRPALLPGLIGVLGTTFGLGGLGEDWWMVILFVVSIFALIMLIFAIQSRQWWWIPLFAAIAIIWNPVWPISFENAQLWLPLSLGAAALFAVAGFMMKVPTPPGH